MIIFRTNLGMDCLRGTLNASLAGSLGYRGGLVMYRSDSLAVRMARDARV